MSRDEKEENKNNTETPAVSWMLWKAQDTGHCVLGHLAVDSFSDQMC